MMTTSQGGRVGDARGCISGKRASCRMNQKFGVATPLHQTWGWKTIWSTSGAQPLVHQNGACAARLSSLQVSRNRRLLTAVVPIGPRVPCDPAGHTAATLQSHTRPLPCMLLRLLRHLSCKRLPRNSTHGALERPRVWFRSQQPG